MLINVILLRTDHAISVAVVLVEDIVYKLLVERVVARLPPFFILQLQIFFHLETEKHLRVNSEF